MKIIRAISLAICLFVPVAAVASPTVRAACSMGCCPDCPFCPSHVQHH